ncbi:LLM class flavin-dependent oxidoreductase [Rhodococcus sp. B10]|uniref:LLM class flavin-dependent oxidoreductase n=1 Tax=Rhodococcus sp. B10 TaxID=2695876 RepID=UPI0014315A8E|nr:LLM class flavin-dependent oxidoreductase [Rhodococcus sp. B10]NIL77328.1 hypothetical protein [Rhodococcus sp. B10]
MSASRFVVGLSLGQLTAGTDVDIAALLDVARTAESSGIGFLLVEDSYGDETSQTTLDPIAVTSFLGASTTSIGVVATVQPLYLEPFDIGEALATSDFDTLGRTGWLPVRPSAAAHANLFDRPVTEDPDEIDAEIDEFIGVTQRLFDGWEDGAVIRDIESGRYLDVAKLHRIDHHGRSIRVRGPLVTPRSPQGRVPTFLRTSSQRAGTDADSAEVLIAPLGDSTEIAAAVGATPVLAQLDSEEIHATIDTVASLRRQGYVSGVLIRPMSGAALRGLLAHTWGDVGAAGTLREMFGLSRPDSIYAVGTFTEVMS